MDIISPQIYWPFEHKIAPFDTLALWWEEKVSSLSKGRVGLAISLAAYYLDKDELARQVEYARKAGCYVGFALYSASCLE